MTLFERALLNPSNAYFEDAYISLFGAIFVFLLILDPILIIVPDFCFFIIRTASRQNRKTDRILASKKNIQWNWYDFKMPFPIEKNKDPMRTWTIPTQENPYQLVNGASLLINIKVLEITKSSGY